MTDAHTFVMTTLRRDGMPVSLPLSFACVDHAVYVHTRGRKLSRIARHGRAAFLVESGEAWIELKAAHFTGMAELVELDGELLARVETETARKYDAFRTPADRMPEATARHCASTMPWVRCTPNVRILSWDNDKLVVNDDEAGHR